MYVSAYYICVLILLYICPHTQVTGRKSLILLYVSSYYIYVCPHSQVTGNAMDTAGRKSRILLYVSSYYIYVCPHTTIYVSSYYSIRR